MSNEMLQVIVLQTEQREQWWSTVM